ARRVEVNLAEPDAIESPAVGGFAQLERLGERRGLAGAAAPLLHEDPDLHGRLRCPEQYRRSAVRALSDGGPRNGRWIEWKHRHGPQTPQHSHATRLSRGAARYRLTAFGGADRAPHALGRHPPGRVAHTPAPQRGVR